jgi:carboxyl-terminal processing protease
MLAKLRQSHFGVIPAQAYQPMAKRAQEANDAQSATYEGTVGVELRLIDDMPTVWRLDPNSSAASAGVQAGWVLVDVDGKPTADMMAKASKVRSPLVEPEFLKRILVSGLGTCTLGKVQRFGWLDGENHRVETDLVLQRPAGIECKFGNLPTTFVTCQSYTTQGRIPVFALNIFFEPSQVIDQFDQLVRDHHDAPGLILDLRGNIGGLGFMAMSLGGFLTDQSGLQLGLMTTRAGPMKFTLIPRDTVFRGKVAVLVDEFSMSTSEILAAGLQDNALARVFGRKTPGMALPSAIEMLPHGAGFQYAFANYHSAKGEPLEGRGVEPNEPIELTRADLLRGHDADLDAAARWILE